MIVDGTLIYTDRIAVAGPTPGVDLWWSGKHQHHGGNIQVVSAPDGWPLWTLDGQPGREHDITAARADPDLLAAVAAWVTDNRPGLADLGYEGETGIFTIPHKKPKTGRFTIDQQTFNTVHEALRCLGNAPTPCSRPPTRCYVATAVIHGDSARSPPPRSSCSITRTTGPHDPHTMITQRSDPLRGKALLKCTVQGGIDHERPTSVLATWTRTQAGASGCTTTWPTPPASICTPISSLRTVADFIGAR